MSQQQQQQQQQGTEDIHELIRQRRATAGSAQVLDLTDLGLTAFPTEIEFLRDVLEKLTISHNSIRTIPLMLNTFTCLRYLNIRANSIRIFPAVISTLETLDMSRNKISRLPDSFGGLMNLRVLSLSRNRLETLPPYIGHMTRLYFLKIEHNHITFPPPEITEIRDQSREVWLSRLKEYLIEHEGSNPSAQEPIIHLSDKLEHRENSRRTVRAASNESLLPPGSSTHRQSRSDSGLRLSIPQTSDGHGGPRSAILPPSLSPEPPVHKLGRTSSSSSANVHATSNGDDHYRFISHNRGISGDSTSSFGSSSSSNDCEKFGEIYFQRLAALPPPPTPLSTDKLRMIDAARGILFSFSQIYRAVKQCIGCSTDEKLGQFVGRLLLNANNALTQLIQSLDRFDHAAQVQIPDQKLCSEVLRCCEINVAAFRRLVKAVQTQLKPICLTVDGRLVRNLLLLLHGAISEIRVAWDSLLLLVPGALEAQAMVESHHVNHTPYQHPNHSNSNTHLTHGHPQHPLQLSPTLQATPSFGPSYIPQRNQNLSRASNHSAASLGHSYQDDDEDTQLLSTVESAIEAARRLIQYLTETCITRSEGGFAPSPPSASPGAPRSGQNAWARSVTTSPVRSSGSSTSGKSIHSSGGRPTGNGTNGATGGVGSVDKSDNGPDTGLSLTQSPMQTAVDTKSANGASGTTDYLIRSPLFSPVSDTIPYSNGMCVSLPIGIPSQPSSKTGATLSSSPSNSNTQDVVFTSDTLPSIPASQAPRSDGRKMSIWNQRGVPGSRQATPSSPISSKTAHSTTVAAATANELVSSGLHQGAQAPSANNVSAHTTSVQAGTRASTPRGDEASGSGVAPSTTTSTFHSMPLGGRSFSNAGITGGGSASHRTAGIPHQGMLTTGSSVGALSSSLPSGGFLANGGYMALGAGATPVHPHSSHPSHHHHHPNAQHHFYNHGNNTYTQLITPLSALPTATLQNIGSGATPAQLWRDMRDSLNQMTEIVKRLDLDLSMLRVEEHHLHGNMPLHGHVGLNPYHPYHTPHHTMSGSGAVMHPNHPHYTPHGAPYAHGIFGGTDEGNALRRRFAASLNDFVKSVVVISTLMKQLSSTITTTSGSNGTTAVPSTTANSTTITTGTTSTTTTITDPTGAAGAMALAHLQRNQSPPTSPILMSTATMVSTTSSGRSLSSPNQRRSKSDSSTADIVGGSSTASPSFASSMATMNLGTAVEALDDGHKEARPSVEIDTHETSAITESPASAAATTVDGTRVVTSAAAGTGAGVAGAAALASRVKAGRSSSTSAGGDGRHLAATATSASSPVLTPRMTSRSVSMSTIAEKAGKTTPGASASLNGQQQQQSPEIFSRLVLTSVSNLTKITKELTMRMPKSSFRDLVMSHSGSSGGAGAGVGMVNSNGGGVSLLGHALNGGGGPGSAHHPPTGAAGGSSSLPGSGLTTPSSASIPYRHPLVPMGPSYLTGRKASLV
ncbi:RAM signaling network component [Actinomortierella wolfii]|nr:RAM signaling network component [Actinomortierella wolfii]